MAQYTILYWQDIPSMVEARKGRTRAKEQLSDRFQELIDTVAMRKGLFGTDAYLEQWRKGSPENREGTPADVVRAVADELESRYERIESDAYVYVDDADALCREFAERGATILREPTDGTSYSLRDFVVADLDGNRLLFGSPKAQGR